MLNGIATLEDAIEVANYLLTELPNFVKKENPTKTQKTEYTGAIWETFKKLASERNWNIYPPAKPTRGRGKGEYLVDFALFDQERGCRIACESDWGDIGEVKWAFDKLRGVKADIKILIFEAKRLNNDLTARYAEKFKEVLGKSHHHHPGREIYIFIQFDKTDARVYLWIPKTTGPMRPDEIVFDILQ